MNLLKNTTRCLAAALLGGGLVACSSSPSPGGGSRTVTAELTDNPAEAQRWFERGREAIQEGDLPAAQDCFERALAADPQHGPSHNNLGKIQFSNGDLREAAISFRASEESMPYRPEPLNNLGLVFEAGNRLDDATEQFEAAVVLAPNSIEYLANLARARVRRGDRDNTLREQLTRISREDPRERWKTWAAEQLRQFDRR